MKEVSERYAEGFFFAVKIIYLRGEDIMNVLVINCGSSSLKYQLINSDTEAVLAKGLCERIVID